MKTKNTPDNASPYAGNRSREDTPLASLDTNLGSRHDVALMPRRYAYTLLAPVSSSAIIRQVNVPYIMYTYMQQHICKNNACVAAEHSGPLEHLSVFKSPIWFVVYNFPSGHYCTALRNTSRIGIISRVAPLPGTM